MKYIVFIFCFFSCLQDFAQDELINVSATGYAMYGGMEDSGVSRSYKYVFVAQKDIEMVNVLLDSTKLQLQKGDSLVVNLNTFEPYNSRLLDDHDEHEFVQAPTNIYFAQAYRRQLYIVNIAVVDWSILLQYVYKRIRYTAVKKESLDAYQSHYAP